MQINSQIKMSKGFLPSTLIPILIVTAFGGLGWYSYYDKQKSHETVVLINQKEKKGLEDDLKQSQSSINALESRQLKLNGQNKRLLDQVNNHRQQTNSLNQRIVQFKNNLIRLRSELAVSNDQTTIVKTALIEERKNLKLAVEKTARLENSMQQMRDQVAKNVTKLEKQLEQRQTLEASLSAQIDSVSDEKKALFVKLQGEEQRRYQLQNQILWVNNNVDIKAEALLDAKQGLDKLQTKFNEIRIEKDNEAAEFVALRKKLEQELNQTQIQFTQLKNKMRIINLTSEVLFKSGSAEIKPEGQKVLVLIAATLNNFPNRQVFIEGHTDNIPMSNSSGYRSNWELSSARAISAALILQANNQVSPKRLKVVGHSEFKPITSNETEEGRRLNRRIEIRLLPESEGAL
jgi:flagellar motor protein MotB